MPFQLKNIKLGILTLFFFFLCMGLAYWQYTRGQEKQKQIHSFTARSQAAPLRNEALLRTKDTQFYPAQLKGRFQNQKTILLDNKIHQGIVGYEIYTPFQIAQSPMLILVDRGFVPLGKSRQILPSIAFLAEQTTTIQGVLTPPLRWVKWGPMVDPRNQQKPLRLEYIDIDALTNLFHQPIYPFVLTLKQSAIANAPTWQITGIPPSRHYGYALQWFALGITLLILLWAFNRSQA